MTDPDSTKPNESNEAHERFVRLFSRERRRLYAFTYSLIPVTADAEDAFQQASVILWRKFAEFDPNRDFFKWACGFVYYTVLNYRRSAKRRRLLFSDDLVRKLADDRIDWSRHENDRVDALEDCLSMLKSDDRKLLTDIYGHGKSPADLSVELQKSVQTIYNRVSKIRRRLLNCMNLKMSDQIGAGTS